MRYIGIVDRDLGGPIGLAWSPDGEMLAVCGSRGIHLYNQSLEKFASLEMPKTKEFLWQQCIAVAWNTAGSLVVGIKHSGLVIVWDVFSQNIIHRFRTKSRFIESECVKWKPDETTIICVTNKGVSQIWETTTGELVASLNSAYQPSRGTGYPKAIAKWSPDGAKLAGLTTNSCIQIWDSDTHKLIHTLKGHKRQPLAVAWNPDGTQIASGGLDRSVIIWDVATGTKLKRWQATYDIQTIDWSSDGQRLAGMTVPISGRVDLYKPVITFWDAMTGGVLNTIENHLMGIKALAWSPDGIRMATIASDSSVEIWIM